MKLIPQLLEHDPLDEDCFFLGEVFPSSAAVGTFHMETIRECHRILQEEAEQKNGLFYAREFENGLLFVEDGKTKAMLRTEFECPDGFLD